MRAIILTALMFMTYGLFSNECGEFFSCDKTYVKGEQIGFSENQIFVKVDGLIILTSAIHADAAGYYFLDYNPKPCEKPDWKCGWCSTCNANWSWTCKNCGRLRGDNNR